MIYTRYRTAAELCAGKRVLELACGGGNGLGLVGSRARSLVGGDYSPVLIRAAKAHYRSQFPLLRLSAEQLPFRNCAFEVVLFFEASYYVPDMEAALDEVARVLAADASVLFVNANPERPDFIRSPHSVHYHTADEFRTALEQRGFAVTTEGAFPVDPPAEGLKARVLGLVVSAARRLLEGLGLVPRTLRGRARLKRLVYGSSLPTVPAELLRGFAAVARRTPISAGPVRDYKVIYVHGTRWAE